MKIQVYALTVIAEDGAPSSLLKNGRPNQTPNKFRCAPTIALTSYLLPPGS